MLYYYYSVNIRLCRERGCWTFSKQREMEELTALVEDYSYWYYVMDNPKVEDYGTTGSTMNCWIWKSSSELQSPIPLPAGGRKDPQHL